MTTTVAEIVVDAPAAAWRGVGFDVADHVTAGSGVLRLDGITIRLTGDGRGSGVRSWTLTGAPDPSIATIDGLLTTHGLAEGDGPNVHPNGVTRIDHLVVQTPDLERTCAAITAATGAPLKRIREAGSVRQGFHRLGELIVEVVTHPQVAPGAAAFWGLALVVSDIDAVVARCGPSLVSSPREAVQAGRRIASFRPEAGLGVPVAVMTPHQRHAERSLGEDAPRST